MRLKDKCFLLWPLAHDINHCFRCFRVKTEVFHNDVGVLSLTGLFTDREFSILSPVRKGNRLEMKIKSLLAFGALTLALPAFSVHDTLKVPTAPAFEILADDPVLVAMDDMMASNFFNFYCFSADTALLNVHCFDKGVVPPMNMEEVASKMAFLDKQTPFNLVLNSEVEGFIKLYAERKRELTSRALGLAQMYFPLFEQMLDKYQIPYEMKYLAVIESALNPLAKSRAGAMGLWQFMYHTGKMFDLDVNSYVDERMDPVKSTEAACKYLRYLYGLYDDWNLAMAAYNCGPGNVNKAIRRSGGKKDFWELRPFLPKETASYVPAFIAVNYVMNHASDHNIYPLMPGRTYFELDTLHVTQKLTFVQIAAVSGLSADEVAHLNPSYKLGIIPDNGKKNILILPTVSAGSFLANLENLPKVEPTPQQTTAAEPVTAGNTPSVSGATGKILHSVKSGETLTVIARKHGVTIEQIKQWNKIKGTTIYKGQKLTIYPKNKQS